MKTITIFLALIAITVVGSLSLILAINEDNGNLENDVKKIEMIQYPQTTIKKLDDKSSIKTTITTLNVPENNTLPFGFIKGNVVNPTEGHPVILQIYKTLEEGPIHIAQVELNEDNTFEYSFRVLSVEDGITTHLYEGDYLVKVIKVVNMALKDQS